MSSVGNASSIAIASLSCPALPRSAISSSIRLAASCETVRRSFARSARFGKSASTSSSSFLASAYRSPCSNRRTTRSRSSASVRSMCCEITRLRTSGGIEVVASRMSSRSGFSVCTPSSLVHRGVISVMPCTTSTRPPAVASARIRRPKLSNGVVSRIPPTPVIRRPFSGIRWGIFTRSMPGSTGASSILTTFRLEIMVRVSWSSHIRIGSPALPPPVSASGSTATPGSFANRPSSTRPSANSTRSAKTGVDAKSHAAARPSASPSHRDPGGVADPNASMREAPGGVSTADVTVGMGVGRLPRTEV